jgi:hypothetical protein
LLPGSPVGVGPFLRHNLPSRMWSHRSEILDEERRADAQGSGVRPRKPRRNWLVDWVQSPPGTGSVGAPPGVTGVVKTRTPFKAPTLCKLRQSSVAVVRRLAGSRPGSPELTSFGCKSLPPQQVGRLVRAAHHFETGPGLPPPIPRSIYELRSLFMALLLNAKRVIWMRATSGRMHPQRT